jgi:hypothetical protein
MHKNATRFTNRLLDAIENLMLRVNPTDRADSTRLVHALREAHNLLTPVDVAEDNLP